MRVRSREVAGLDPYQLMAALGKRVGTTATEIVHRFGARVTAIDIDEQMLAAAHANVQRAGLDHRIELQIAGIQQLPFPDETFDKVVIEAVTMFVRREQAVAEVVRVCKIGGRIVDHEFI